MEDLANRALRPEFVPVLCLDGRSICQDTAAFVRYAARSAATKDRVTVQESAAATPRVTRAAAERSGRSARTRR